MQLGDYVVQCSHIWNWIRYTGCPRKIWYVVVECFEVLSSAIVGNNFHCCIFYCPLGLLGSLNFNNMSFLSEVTAYLVKKVILTFDWNGLVLYLVTSLTKYSTTLLSSALKHFDAGYEHQIWLESSLTKTQTIGKVIEGEICLGMP